MEEIPLRHALDRYYRQIQAIIIDKQNPVTGLLPASTAITSHGNYRDAWVRDNVYSILAVWGLGLAYQRLDNDDGRGYELRQRTVKLMRGLLRSMMAQAHKVEAFKVSRHPKDALHAKYDTDTGAVVVGDHEWGHLQIDAVSLYLLMLAQMIASGLEIIWTKEEVSFVQNLVYYIERAYRTPDYGIWERGAKSNRGNVELNASSLGMAKAALEALAGFDLFGARGSQRSVIHVAPDNIAQSNITLCAMLPRESNTKEIDAALLSVIGFPAFAVRDKALVQKVRREIVGKLEGRYGLKRFLRDGHQTVLEDEGRLYYEQEELKRFEHVESEWPLFFAYLYLDAIFRGARDEVAHYRKRLEEVRVEQDGFGLLPELYFVPAESVDAERQNPHSQLRLPNENVPLVWAQSLYLLGGMLEEGLLRRSELDPLGRRRARPAKVPVIQVVLLSEDEELQAELTAHGVPTETLASIAPVRVFRPQDIAEAHGQVGRSDRLGLSGRAARALKSLTTSRIYLLRKERVVCLAPFFLPQDFYLTYDMDFLVRRFRSELSYLRRNWTELGRPTVTLLLTKSLLDADRTSFYKLMHEIRAGNVGKTPVRRGRLAELIATASFERIDELYDWKPPEEPLAELLTQPSVLSMPGHPIPLTPSEELAIERAAEPAPLLERLAHSNNLYEEIELLSALTQLMSIDAEVPLRGQVRTLRELIEEVYAQAGRLRLWSVLRHAAGLLDKVEGDLSLAVGALLVAQKHVQVGRAYSDDSLITRPLPEHELLDKIRTFCREDVRERVLTQEVLLYLGSLVKARPELFAQLMTLRVSHLTVLLTSKLVRAEQTTADEAYERLISLPPSEIQSRLEAVLEEYRTLQALPQELEQLNAEAATPSELGWQQDLGLERLEAPSGGWLAWRQHQGVLDRRPPEFYARVWEIFHHAPGLVIGSKWDKRSRLESNVVLSDMTPGEKSFALLIEHMLNHAPSAEYRQLTVETLNALASFCQQNPSLKIDEPLVVDTMIGHAVHQAYLDQHPEHEANYAEHKSDAWEAYYARSPAETTLFLVSALRNLLTLRAA